jgi:membrane dipeptidase
VGEDVLAVNDRLRSGPFEAAAIDARCAAADRETLPYRDHRSDPAGWARDLSIPVEAVELYLSCEVIDLLTPSFVWTQVLPRYDLGKRHRPWLPRSAFINQLDLPRAREAQFAALCWDIPTDPVGRLHRRSKRLETTRRNIARIERTLARFPQDFALATSVSDYRTARERGLTAGFIGVQGGEAFEDSLEELDRVADLVHRITLVRLTESRVGAPANKRGSADVGLSRLGREYAQRMQANRILVDLSHINRKGFVDALDATDPSIPVAVTHAGVNAVRRLWRNIDDDQIRAVAERGGTVGIVFHPYFLAPALTCPLDTLADHMEHVVRTAGEDFVSIGSDFDGMITLPDGFRDVTHMPKLVAILLQRGWPEERIAKAMGGNFVRVLEAVRP